MSLEKLKAKIGDDLFSQVKAKLGEGDFFFAEGKEYIPIAKFNEVNDAKKELEKSLASRDTQLAELQKTVKGNEELTKKIEELQTTNAKEKEAHEAKVLEIQKSYELDSILNSSGAKNTKALRGMLDLEKCTFKDGKWQGLDEQVAQIKKDNDWLFESQVPGSAGKQHQGGGNGGSDEFADFRNLY